MDVPFKVACQESDNARFPPEWVATKNPRLACVRSSPCAKDIDCHQGGRIPDKCLQGWFLMTTN